MKIRSLSVVLLYFVAANVPLWLASHILGLWVSGCFNIEFVVIGILSLFLSRSLTFALLLVAILLDVLCCVEMTYMLSPAEMFASTSSFFVYIPLHIWAVAGIVSVTIIVCCLASYVSDKTAGSAGRRRIGLILAGLAVIGIGIDFSMGEIGGVRTDMQLGQYRLFRNSLHRLMRSEIAARPGNPLNPLDVEGAGISGASAKLMNINSFGEKLQRESSRPNVVFVVVESWGQPVSEIVSRSLTSPYMEDGLKARYTVTMGTVPFRGATVAGEVRELCGDTMGFGVISAPSSRLGNCLPRRLERAGYHTMSVHGFEATMFERNSWYGKVGFRETWFRSQLEAQGLPRCPGPFPGICDAAIADWIGGRLDANAATPQFIYWLTLNSHLPIPVLNLVKNPPSCSGMDGLTDQAVCAWYKLIFNVHRSVSSLAMRETKRPTIFVIVGDHAPPFASERRREEFASAVVPYIVLWPKGMDTGDVQPLNSAAAIARPMRLQQRNGPKSDQHLHVRRPRAGL